MGLIISMVCMKVCVLEKEGKGGIFRLGCGVIMLYLLAPTTEAEVRVDSSGARWHMGVADAALAASVISLLTAGNPIMYPKCRVKSCTASVK